MQGNVPAPPPRVPFSLQQGEAVLRVIRRHWAHIAWKLIKYAVAAVVPAAALLVAWSMIGELNLVAWAIAAAWVLIWAARAYLAWYQYRNDLWVVTNQRVVDSNKRHWFHHQMASADLVGVEDMSVQKSGVVATLFNFGTVNMQTAGAQSRFVISGVPDPGAILALIDAHRDIARKELRMPLG
jgi:hypothetical protein